MGKNMISLVFFIIIIFFRRKIHLSVIILQSINVCFSFAIFFHHQISLVWSYYTHTLVDWIEQIIIILFVSIKSLFNRWWLVGWICCSPGRDDDDDDGHNCVCIYNVCVCVCVCNGRFLFIKCTFVCHTILCVILEKNCHSIFLVRNIDCIEYCMNVNDF